MGNLWETSGCLVVGHVSMHVGVLQARLTGYGLSQLALGAMPLETASWSVCVMCAVPAAPFEQGHPAGVPSLALRAQPRVHCHPTLTPHPPSATIDPHPRAVGTCRGRPRAGPSLRPYRHPLPPERRTGRPAACGWVRRSGGAGKRAGWDRRLWGPLGGHVWTSGRVQAYGECCWGMRAPPCGSASSAQPLILVSKLPVHSLPAPSPRREEGHRRAALHGAPLLAACVRLNPLPPLARRLWHLHPWRAGAAARHQVSTHAAAAAPSR